VTGAGGLTFSNGKITSISNSSGHYKPHTSHLLQTVEQLLQQGLLLDKTYVMVDPATGKGVPLTGKAKDLYDKTLQAQQRIEMGKAVLRRQEREVDAQVRRIELLVDEQGSCRSGAEPEFQSGLEELVRLLKEAHATDEALKRDIDLVGKARDLLRRLGATEANRIDDSVQVMNLDVSDTMRGHQVKKASSSAKQVSLKEFVTSGGGQKGEAHLKKAMQKELLAKQAEVRKKLDEAAPEADPARRPVVPPVPDSEVEKALEELYRIAPEPPPTAQPQPIDDDDDEVTY
jgi:hypothetical protein